MAELIGIPLYLVPLKRLFTIVSINGDEGFKRNMEARGIRILRRIGVEKRNQSSISCLVYDQFAISLTTVPILSEVVLTKSQSERIIVDVV